MYAKCIICMFVLSYWDFLLSKESFVVDVYFNSDQYVVVDLKVKSF